MKHFAIIALLGVSSATLQVAHAQQPPAETPPSQEEMAVLGGIAQCLVAGVPQDWRQAEMKVELPAPGADTGGVTYLVTRALAGGASEPFQPCDIRHPARALVEMRKLQPPERAGWNAARFTIHRDGKFDLKYDYPKVQ